VTGTKKMFRVKESLQSMIYQELALEGRSSSEKNWLTIYKQKSEKKVKKKLQCTVCVHSTVHSEIAEDIYGNDFVNPVPKIKYRFPT
jgi:hypothetical protein